jgi:hypothetical protein
MRAGADQPRPLRSLARTRSGPACCSMDLAIEATHSMMRDPASDEVAQLLINWIWKHVDKRDPVHDEAES